MLLFLCGQHFSFNNFAHEIELKTPKVHLKRIFLKMPKKLNIGWKTLIFQFAFTNLRKVRKILRGHTCPWHLETLTQSFILCEKYLQNTFTPKPWEALQFWGYVDHPLCVRCQVRGVRCHLSGVTQKKYVQCSGRGGDYSKLSWDRAIFNVVRYK